MSCCCNPGPLAAWLLPAGLASGHPTPCHRKSQRSACLSLPARLQALARRCPCCALRWPGRCGRSSASRRGWPLKRRQQRRRRLQGETASPPPAAAAAAASRLHRRRKWCVQLLVGAGRAAWLGAAAGTTSCVPAPTCCFSRLPRMHPAHPAPIPPLCPHPPRLQAGPSSGEPGDGGFMPPGEGGEEGAAPGARRKAPKIFFATRTHSQITQVGAAGSGGGRCHRTCGCRIPAAPAMRGGRSADPKPACPCPCPCLQVVKELKRSDYRPRMAVLVGAAAATPCDCCLPAEQPAGMKLLVSYTPALTAERPAMPQPASKQPAHSCLASPRRALASITASTSTPPSRAASTRPVRSCSRTAR